MAFESISQGFGMNPVNYGRPSTLDQSQIEKIKESGYMVMPVASSTEGVNLGTPTAKQIMPGVSIPGYQDTRGNFFVVQETGVVNQVTPGGTTMNGGTAYTPPFRGEDPPVLGPPLIYDPPPGSNGGGGGNPPIMPPPPPPPPNFGSGKIFTRFENGDVVPNQQEIITRAMWSGNVGNLTTFYTSSAQSATSKRYYYEIYNSSSGTCGSDAQFSVAYGHKAGSGSADEGGQINDTPSRAVYGQWRLICLDGDTPRFTIGGRTTDHIYVVTVNRARMREYIDEGNIEINIAALSGSEFNAGGGLQNAHTGSNVRIAGSGKVIRLIDDSTINSATVTDSGESYQMVSGSIEDGVYNPSAPHVYGTMYRRLGVVILDADKMDQSASFLTVTGSEIPGDNAYKLFTAISGAALYTDVSGDRLGFAARSAERVKSTHYFCRVKNGEFNFSNNPTFVTGSEGDLAEPLMIGNPIVYITTIGLYNERKEMVAVAKVSRAIKKSFTTEALVKVKLEF
jgi:hypothetical protein